MGTHKVNSGLAAEKRQQLWRATIPPFVFVKEV
jgi:hypothetical protein